MRIFTAWDVDTRTAAVDWRYPYEADPFPSGAINTALAHFYNLDDGTGERGSWFPYLFIARDETGEQTGLVVLDPGDMADKLTRWDIASYWTNVLDSAFRHHLRSPTPLVDSATSIEGDMVAIRWAYPTGFQFPADAVNAILDALYTAGVQPFIYPVFDRADEESELRQVGLLISESRDMAGDPSENWRDLRRDWLRITNTLHLHPEVPWGQTEWSLL